MFAAILLAIHIWFKISVEYEEEIDVATLR